MKVQAATLAVCSLALSALALPKAGAPAQFACHSTDDSPSTFVARDTAVPNFIQGLLTSDGREVSLQCRKVPAPAPGPVIIADGTTDLLECIEERAGEGRLAVTVYEGGFIGGTWANVVREPLLPTLDPDYVATLRCDR